MRASPQARAAIHRLRTKVDEARLREQVEFQIKNGIEALVPVGTTGAAIDQIDAAKGVCRSCEALEPCLDFALATNQESGVWGGTSEEERRKLRKAWLAARRSQRVAI